MITALIAEDEPLARARLRRLLEPHDVQILGEAENGVLALQLTEELRPDLLFLDIQMPGATGMQIAAAMLQLSPPPLIIFVTGYSQYAVAAFETNALDYLTKPVTAARLSVALERARNRLEDRQARDHIRRTVGENALGEPPMRCLPIRGAYSVKFVPVQQIVCALARDKRVFIRTRDGEYRTYYTLTQLEKLLPADQFLRIHDSSLVNLEHIAQMDYLGDHAYEVRLSNGQALRVGRTRYPDLQRRLGLAIRAGS
jgi:DNA-binding LytR/AlgR family response regulator